MADLTETEKYIRKLRKKLRQIEALESSGRELNEEEATKVSSKASLRSELALLLAEIMKRRSTEKLEELDNNINERTEVLQERRSKKPCVQASSAGDVSTPPEDEAASTSTTSTVEPTAEPTVPSAEPTASSVQPSAPPKEQVLVEEATSSTATQSVRRERKPKIRKSEWRDKEFIVWNLEGHDDVVLATALHPSAPLALSGGRDTTVRVWNLDSQSLIHSMRGHTGPVTCLAFVLQTEALKREYPSSPLMAISGSIDCAVKLWDLSSGTMLKSIYTYNGIKCLAYDSESHRVFTGTDGGKIEVFDLISGQAKHSVKAHDDCITSIDLCGPHLCSGDAEGSVRVWTSDAIRCVFVSEDLRPENGAVNHQRSISTLKLNNGCIVAGDNGSNLKLIEWKKGVFKKISNHVSDVGFTDSLSLTSDLLLASSFDVDTGYGCVNMFQLRSGSPAYVCSMCDDETTRIFSVSAAASDAKISVLTGGRELRLWQVADMTHLPEEDCLIVKPEVLAIYANNVVDSASESEASDSEVSERSTRPASAQSEQKKGWWCSIA